MAPDLLPVAILVPVLRRPANVAPLLDSIHAATPQPHRVVFCCSSDDPDEIAAIDTAGAERIICGRWRPIGDYARKINIGYQFTTEPLLFLAADDLRFRRNWLSIAAGHLSAQIHVVGTNDLGNRRVMNGHHSTHTLVTREYCDVHGTIDRRRTVLTTEYPHTFCDDEFIQTAIARRMFVSARNSIVEHLHPNWHKAEWDDIYQIADDSLAPGRRIFNRRRRLWQAKERQSVLAERRVLQHQAAEMRARSGTRQGARGQ